MAPLSTSNSQLYPPASNFVQPSAAIVTGSGQSADWEALQHDHQMLKNFNTVLLEQIRMLTGIEPQGIPAYFSQAFRTDWQTRTDQRKLMYCSNNRKGSSSCAWHSSRHQPREHAARRAPEGFLNCGCTDEEALFEASLAMHGVGSYNAGDGQRLDPAMRRALLVILQRRYGYRDGDFEIDPKTGGWAQGMRDSSSWPLRKPTS
ncbi:hypothetical protein BKA62DRAFT_622246 [Auriculariales sp. MPI-PUGE-AT-0066]|nr:hypothetical protein BKA62DRAFT_622246 [Auriculariales sp. MPI-PUGE-AT-0066]